MKPESFFYEFHGIKCEVYTNANTLEYYSSMPWRFRVWKRNGKVVHFAGVPNYCCSRQSAMMRAKARCKWIADGTFEKRYV